MNKLKTVALAALLSAAAAAIAAEAPTPERFPSSNQKKVVSVQHWNVIANDMVDSMVAGLGDQVSRGMYFNQGPDASKFTKQLTQFMIDSAVQRGVPVFTQPRVGASIVDLTTLVTSHKSKVDVLPSAPHSALALGILVVREAVRASVDGGLVVAALGADAVRYSTTPPPRSEFTVTASVQQNGQYVARATNIYYLDSADLGLFFESEGKTLRVEGGQ